MFEGELPTEYASGVGYIVSTWRNTLLILWSGAITGDGLDASERAGKMLVSPKATLAEVTRALQAFRG